MDRKKAIEFIGALFVAVIFITSYAAFSSQSPRNTTSTSSAVATYYAVGHAYASITGYNGILNINTSCRGAPENATLGRINTAATYLEDNGSVLTYSSSGSSFQIAPGTTDSLQIYRHVYEGLGGNYTGCAAFSTLATVTLPDFLNMSAQGQKITVNVPQSSAQQQLDLELNQSMANTVYLRVSSLITQNGTVYGGISISRA